MLKLGDYRTTPTTTTPTDNRIPMCLPATAGDTIKLVNNKIKNTVSLRHFDMDKINIKMTLYEISYYLYVSHIATMLNTLIPRTAQKGKTNISLISIVVLKYKC